MTQKPLADLRLAESRAATMLRSALDRAHRERRLSIRTLGKQLGYKQATVISHMATGRVPIPLDRAIDIAAAVHLSPAEFLLAAIEQRAPTASDVLQQLLPRHELSGFAAELEAIAGQSLDLLPDEHKAVLREVVSDRAPRRRWLSLPALQTISEIQEARPNFAERGLAAIDLNAISGVLSDDP